MKKSRDLKTGAVSPDPYRVQVRGEGSRANTEGVLAASKGFPGGPVVRSLPASGRGAGDSSLIPALGGSPGGGNGNPPSILAWEIPWTEDIDELYAMGSQKSQAGLSN